MATEVIKKIGSGAGDDYSTLASWYAARKGNLVTRNTIEIAEVRGATHNTSTSHLTMLNADNTVDSTHYFKIRPMTGANWFDGDFDNLTGIPVFTTNSSSVARPHIFSSTVDYTVIEGIVIKNCANTGGANSLAALINSGSSSITRGCGVQNISVISASNGGSCYGIRFGVNSLVYNNVVNNIYMEFNGNNKPILAVGFQSISDTIITSYLYNNIVANITAKFAVAGGTSACQAIGFNFSSNATNNIAGIITNLSTSGTKITNCYRNITTQLTNIADDNTGTILKTLSDEVLDTSLTTFDGHLKSNAYSIGNGTNLSSMFTQDIERNTRFLPWSIGVEQRIFYEDNNNTFMKFEPTSIKTLVDGVLVLEITNA